MVVGALTFCSHAYTETGYLPENFLPDFLDLVIWGHEHECLIDPTYNPEMNFHVMQPGSSVATSLMPGEAIPKHVAVLSITGKDFKVETIRLKSVRPFIMKEIMLSEEKEPMKLAKKANNRTELTRFLEGVVNAMIKQANDEWEEAQGDEERDEDENPPLPLIRLRVEYTPPEGGNFDCENPQRFSNRFVNKVANLNDVVQFHRKKAGTNRKAMNSTELPEESTLSSLVVDSVKVEKLVREFLSAQSLTILPQNSFGDAVSQFVDKDDKHAMESFVMENLSKQVEELMKMDHVDEETIQTAMEEGKSKLEQLFADGHVSKKARRKPRPDDWDSDLNGDWADQPMAVVRSDLEDEEESDVAPTKPTAKGRGRPPGASKKAAQEKKSTSAKSSRFNKKVIEEDSDEAEEEDEDMVMAGSDEDQSQSQLFIKPAPPIRASKKTAPAPKKRATTRTAASQPTRQSQLKFSQPTAKSQMKTKVEEVSEDEISDDDDAFEPAPSTRSARSRR